MARVDRVCDIARVMSKGNHGNRQNMVSLVVSSGRVISVGFNNMDKTHTAYYNGTFSKGVHAEYDALRGLRHRDLGNAKMYVLYFRRDGKLGNSKPCKECQKHISDFGVRTVYFMEDGEWTKL